MSSADPWAGVGRTALGVARVRAGESGRPDRLFDDPYAAAFVAAYGEVFAEESERPVSAVGAAFAFHAIIRTRFYDDYLLAAGCRQVVLLAAGLDTRAYRLRWSAGVRLYELDLPEVLASKERVLAEQGAVPRCERVTVPVDLREDWPARLVAAGYDRAEPTAWLVEGLLIYLAAEEADLLLTRVGDLSAAGSRLSFERGGSPLRAQARATPGMARYAEMWKGGLGEDAAGWLARHGWRVESHDVGTVAASYGRGPSGEADSGFLTATYAGLE